MNDSRARYNLERAIAEVPDGTRYQDPSGLAVYQTEPSWATAVACPRCLYVAVLPTIPRRPVLRYVCSQCSSAITLMPPLQVLGVPSRSIVRSGQATRPS